MKPFEVGTVSKVRSEMIVQFIWEAQNNLKKEKKKKKTSGGKVYCGVSQAT